MKKFAPVVLICIGLAGCQTSSEQASSQVGYAVIEGPSGQAIGSARLFRLRTVLTLNLALSQAEPGDYVVKFHANGDCHQPGFTSAGQPLASMPSLSVTSDTEDPHNGGLPRLKVSESGQGTMSALLSDRAPEQLAMIFDNDSTAIGVHYVPDESDSKGSSRIACGVFIPA